MVKNKIFSSNLANVFGPLVFGNRMEVKEEWGKNMKEITVRNRERKGDRKKD